MNGCMMNKKQEMAEVSFLASGPGQRLQEIMHAWGDQPEAANCENDGAKNMMTNKEKQQAAETAQRLFRLETRINEIFYALGAEPPPLSCNECGVQEPIETGYRCSKTDCCMGLNPADDENNSK